MDLHAIASGDGPSALVGLLADDTGELSALDPPLFWPGIAAEEAVAEWEALHRWVARMVERFDWDLRTLPRCWYRHNAHVEALAALRDHERASYGDSAPLTAAIEWHRALRDVEGRLREWTSRIGCLARHEPCRFRQVVVGDDDWASFLADDVTARQDRAIAAALEGPEC